MIGSQSRRTQGRDERAHGRTSTSLKATASSSALRRGGSAAPEEGWRQEKVRVTAPLSVLLAISVKSRWISAVCLNVGVDRSIDRWEHGIGRCLLTYPSARARAAGPGRSGSWPAAAGSRCRRRSGTWRTCAWVYTYMQEEESGRGSIGRKLCLQPNPRESDSPAAAPHGPARPAAALPVSSVPMPTPPPPPPPPSPSHEQPSAPAAPSLLLLWHPRPRVFVWVCVLGNRSRINQLDRDRAGQGRASTQRTAPYTHRRGHTHTLALAEDTPRR